MQEKTQKQRGGTLRLVRRFGEFMTGSGWKYFGCVLTVGVTVLVSFVTPLLIGGTVDAITDALSGRTGAALDFPEPFLGWFNARGGADFAWRATSGSWR